MTTPQTVSNPPRRLPLVGGARLGVLSLHLDGTPCRVGCEYCYLGGRTRMPGALEVVREPGALATHGDDLAIAQGGETTLDVALIEELLGKLDYSEVAVALSEPAIPQLPALAAIVRAAAARGRGVAVTTTASVLSQLARLGDERGEDPLAGVVRVNLSVDPRKGPTAAPWVAGLARRARASGRQVALIVSLVDARFAEQLVAGQLAALVELPEVDMVALHGLKPPPDWCNAAFWLSAFARLAPLLDRHLDRRLFLDCYVAARILKLGGCPARPDVSPGREFRSCVYQSAPDFTFANADDLLARTSGFVAPAVCPFPIR